jgi:hypothetical protein
MNDEERGSASLEDVAISMLRKARGTCEHMGQAGIRAAAFADWLEAQVPRVSESCRRLVRTVLNDALGRGLDGKGD